MSTASRLGLTGEPPALHCYHLVLVCLGLMQERKERQGVEEHGAEVGRELAPDAHDGKDNAGVGEREQEGPRETLAEMSTKLVGDTTAPTAMSTRLVGDSTAPTAMGA